MIEQNVSGTAFLVNVSRTKMLEISKDIYANLWVTPESIAMWNEFAREAYPNDGLNLSLRNRFFLEHLKSFVAANDDSVFVNIAAGFTNYPFLIDGDCRYIETDLPNIIEFKKNKIKEWIKNKKLPDRKIDFIAADLNNREQREKLKETMAKIIGHRHSFVVMEGLTYYLKREVLTDIFKIIAEIQPKKSITAFDYWRPDSLEYPMTIRLKKYLFKRFGSESAQWNLIDEKYIKEIDGFVEIEKTNNAELELEYSKTRIFQGREHKIPVCFSVLEKI